MTADPGGACERLEALTSVYARLRPAAERWTLERAGRSRRAAAVAPADTDEAEWDAGQVLAHLVDACQFWLGEIERIVDADAMGRGPVGIGRTPGDPSRTVPIERDRYLPGRELCARLESTLERALRRCRELRAEERSATCVHPALGPMTVDLLIADRLIGHLEGHVAQLEAALGPARE
jgi:hypothetical protein